MPQRLTCTAVVNRALGGCILDAELIVHGSIIKIIIIPANASADDGITENGKVQTGYFDDTYCLFSKSPQNELLTINKPSTI